MRSFSIGKKKKIYKIHFKNIGKSLKFFLGSSDLPNFKRHILASKQNFQAWIALRDSIGQPTSVKERRNVYNIFKNFKCSNEHLFQALLVKTEKEKAWRNSEEAFEECIQHESGEIDPISRMVIVWPSSYWYLSYFCVILKHGLILTWNTVCDKKVIQNFTFSLNSLLHFRHGVYTAN